MITSWTALVDLGRADPERVDLDTWAAHHAVLAGTARGTVELILTVPAESLHQAATTAVALVIAGGYVPHALQVLPTDDFDTRAGLAPLPEVISVAEAAALLGVTGSAVRERLARGTLPGRRVGRDWRLPRHDIELVAATARPRGA